MWVGVQRHAPAVLPQVKTRHPLYRRLGGSQGWAGRVCNISPHPTPPGGIRFPDHPARSESLHLLSYASPHQSLHVYLRVCRVYANHMGGLWSVPLTAWDGVSLLTARFYSMN